MGIGPFQIVIIMVLGVLIFGKNLPDVARRVGAGLMEFKKGLNEMKDLSMKSSGPKRASSAEDISEDVFEGTDKHESFGRKFEVPGAP